MSKILPVVWHDQRNNTLSPYGTCNATSISTVMQWLGVQPPDWDPGKEQRDDYVTRQLDSAEAWDVHRKTLADWKDWNPRNNHFVLKWYIEKALPVKDRMVTQSLPNHFDDIKASIDADMPVICGGSYSRVRKNGTGDVIGHINVIVGYTDTSFIFCDPFGNAMTKYLNPNGDHVEYPYSFCLNALTLAHILSKKS